MVQQVRHSMRQHACLATARPCCAHTDSGRWRQHRGLLRGVEARSDGTHCGVPAAAAGGAQGRGNETEMGEWSAHTPQAAHSSVCAGEGGVQWQHVCAGVSERVSEWVSEWRAPKRAQRGAAREKQQEEEGASERVSARLLQRDE